MSVKLTFDEYRVRRDLKLVRGFPKWKSPSNSVFVYRISTKEDGEIVRKDGEFWSAGSKEDGTYRAFKSLTRALDYAEFLSKPRLWHLG
jgi:hypothetical protein